MKNMSAFQYVLFGMLYGALIPGFIFFFLDKSKGWNPYGWWFIATFGCAILGGLIGLVLFGYITKKRTSQRTNDAVHSDAPKGGA
jgi:prolipoprotein diacylglyceryltransferase